MEHAEEFRMADFEACLCLLSEVYMRLYDA